MLKLAISNFADAEKFPFALHEAAYQQVGYPMHSHNFTELVVVRSGKGLHVTESEEHFIEAGDVFAIAPEQAHSYKDVSSLTLSNILLDLQKLPLPYQYLGELPGYHALFSVEPKLRKLHGFRSRLKLTSDQLGNVNLLLRRLRAATVPKDPGYKVLTIGVLTELLELLARCYTGRSVRDEALDVARLGEVIGKIERDFQQDISLDDLAAMARMSKRTLMRNFKNVFGVSPIHYLLRARVDKAGGLLSGSDMRIDEIALKSGFPDGNYFSRIFKKVKLMTPREYRKRFKS